jgi:hypothetical protein
VATFSTSCAYEKQTYHDKYVSAGELRSPLELISPHTGGWYYIKVNGETYKKVRGVAPFYLMIPTIDSILFVTGDEETTFHVFNIKSKREISIPGNGVNFGGDIGGPQKPGEPFTDWVENANSNEIILAKQYPSIGTNPSTRILITLNLREKRIEQVEGAWRDQSGHLVRQPFK